VSRFEIRRGNPTAQEIAIAITVLRAAAGADAVEAAPSSGARSNWAAPSRLHRPSSHRIGHGAWTLAQRIR
jgi:hypothetical protein